MSEVVETVEPEDVAVLARREWIRKLREEGMSWEQLKALLTEELGDIPLTEALVNEMHRKEFYRDAS